MAGAYAADGAKVIIAEKDEAAGEEALRQIMTAEGEDAQGQIREAKGEDALQQIKAAEDGVCFIRTDVSIPDDVTAMFRQTVELYGTVDVLVNNAGFGIWKSPLDLTVEEWDEVISTNLRGAFLCAREAARVMRGHKGGSVLNIASTRAFMSEPGSEAYAASKGGLVALTHALAASLASDRIRVNCISPGWIETGDYSALREEDHSQHFSGRVGKPDDIARACLFLSSEGNEFISGENIIIDGGMTRRMIYVP